MADNKKYYYLKLKENFYDTEEMIILQNMQDGYLYSDILMKLYLRSLKNNGKLMFKDVIPYTPSALAQVVRHQVGTVEKALKIFQELGLIEVLDNGAIYMLDIQNFIGKSTTEADRKRIYRSQIQEEAKAIGQISDKCPDESTPEIEKEINIEKELEKKKNKNKVDYNNVIQIYNEKCLKLSKVFKVTEKRKTAISKFLKEFTTDDFRKICDIANNNSFLTGKNDRGWKADFDFLMRIDKATAILEGRYSSNNKDDKVQTDHKIEYKEVEMTEEEYIQKLESGGKRYV